MAFHYEYEYLLTWKPDKNKLKRPIYQSLAEQLEADIANGTLPAGTKLPPQRELANYLDINFTTITRAYKICELKGLIYAVTGSGTFVGANQAQSVTISLESTSHEAIDLGFVSSFEQCNDLLSSTARRVLSHQRFPRLGTYDYPTGMPDHKQIGIRWLRSLGVVCEEKNMAIVSGTQNGLALSLLALFKPGSRIAVDTYCFANFIELAAICHIHLVPIKGDSEGMLPDELAYQCRLTSIQGIFLVPSCNNPTTVMISEQRKKELAAVINQYQLILLEDDIHAFLTAGLVEDYHGPLCRYVPDRFVYLSGTSKPICSGLRVTYMGFSPKFRQPLVRALLNINVKTSSLDVEVVSAAIASGKARQIIEKKRQLAIERNSLFDLYFPNAAKPGHPLPFFRWLPIQDSRSRSQVEQELLTKGISVYHSDRFLCGPRQPQQYLRVSLVTTPTIEQFQKGLEILKNSIDI